MSDDRAEPLSLDGVQAVERRYAFENELMDAVTKGQLEKGTVLSKALSKATFPSRTEDILQNMKHYAIVTNTLLRKAAQNGGAPTTKLHSISSGFGEDIEKLTDETSARCLLEQMVLTYCRLVRKHTATSYSPTVQKAITCIDADLTAELSLRILARDLNISSSYLSTLFKKETGQTLTGYIHERRILHAMHLLQTTNLQVQIIAQRCGMTDVHYFSKIFKKFSGVSPRQYRAACKSSGK